MAATESFGRDETIEQVRAYLCTGSVAVVGPPGSGVSMLLRSVARTAELAGQTVRLIRFPDSRHDVLAGCESDLLIVDDCHRAHDDQVLELRDICMARPVVLGVHTGAAAEALAWLWRSGAVERVELDGLDRDAVQQIVEARVPGSASRALVDRVAVRSGGFPGFAVDEIESLRDDSALVHENGLLRSIPTGSVGRRLLERARDLLDGLPVSVAHDVAVTAFVGCLPDGVAATLGVDITPMLLRRLVRECGDASDVSYRVVPPALELALRAVIPPTDAATIRRQLGDGVTGLALDDRVRLMLQAGERVSLEDLGASAWNAMRRNDPVTAVMLAGHAATMGPDGVLVEAEILVEAGGREDATERYVALLDDDTASAHVRARVAVEYSLLLLWDLGLPDEAIAIAEGFAASAAGGPHDAVGRVHLASVTLFNGNPSEALRALADIDIAALDDPIREAAEMARVVASAMTEPHMGCRVDEMHLLLADPVQVAPNSVEPAIRVVAAALALELAGSYTDAASLVRSQTRQLAATGTPIANGWLALAEARAELAIGRPEMARRAAVEATVGFTDANHPSGLRWAVGAALFAAALAGDANACRELSATFDVLRPGVRFLEGDLLRARAWAAWTMGDSTVASRLLRQSIDGSAERGAIALEAVALHDSFRLLRSPVRARLAMLAARSSAPAVVLRADHVNLVAERDATGLLRLVEMFEDQGAWLIAAEVASDAAAIAGADGLRSLARTATGHRTRLTERCGDPRTPSLSDHGPARLTAREHDVASLATAGATSRAIAEQLGLSQRTVDNLLQRVYVKLGVHGRAELTRRLSGRETGT